ncbi:MAG TPA: SpoIIE family protein phosphatase, partial [Spirochaetota bacterium]|nr:SpoIIE family protein phosphatase [Spirochaetota bacterium]
MAEDTSDIRNEIEENVSNLDSETGEQSQSAATSTAKKNKKVRVRFSIQAKFLVFIFILVISVITVLSVKQLQKSKTELLTAVDRNASLILENINTVAFNAMFNPEGIDDIMIADLINKYMDDEEKHIEEIIIYDAEGIVVGTSEDQAQKGQRLQDDLTKKYINSGFIIDKNISITYTDTKNNYNYYLRPITSDILNAPIGVIRIIIDTMYVQKAIMKSTKEIIILALIFLTVSIIFTIVMTRLISTPIKTITSDVRTVGEGNLDHRIKIKTNDEVGFLAREFNKMTVNLKEAQDNLVKAAATEKELEVAGQIQQGLLPAGLIKYDKIEGFGLSKPARTIGGDYFDFFHIKDSLYASVISDVSGKGIPAGLIMTMIKTIIRNAEYDLSGKPVAHVVNNANKYLVHNSDFNKFATINFTLMDINTGKIINADGGHGDYYIYSRHKNELYKLALPEGNPPIG